MSKKKREYSFVPLYDKNKGITYDPMLMDAEEFDKWQEENEAIQNRNRAISVEEFEEEGELGIFKNDEDIDCEDIEDECIEHENVDLCETGLNLAYDGFANLKKGLEMLEQYVKTEEFKECITPNFKNEVFKTWIKAVFFDDKENERNVLRRIEELSPLLEELDYFLNDTEEFDIVKTEDEDGIPVMKYKSMGLFECATRVCPECGLRVDDYVRVCDCGYVFEQKEDEQKEDSKKKDYFMSRTIPASKETVKKMAKIMEGHNIEGLECEREFIDGSCYVAVNSCLVGETIKKAKKNNMKWRTFRVLAELVKQDGGYAFKYYPDNISELLEKNPKVVKEGFLKLYNIVGSLSGDIGKENFYFGLENGAFRSKYNIEEAMELAKKDLYKGLYI